jgi:hypothetical protein
VSAYVKTICCIVALSAWCGGIWSNIRAAKQLRAAGYSIWTFNTRARFNAWKGTNLALFLIYAAIFAAAILAMFVFQ